MSATLALRNARIRTLDASRPCVSAVAIRGNVISMVGSDADIDRVCDASTRVMDLDGAVVVPGLVDAHMHPFSGSEGAVGADLTGLRRLDEVRDALAREHARCADGGWVRGYALAYEAFAETGIRGDMIEDAVGGAPALVSFFDFHTALATPAALARAGVTGPRTFAEAAEVVCVDGVPTGELREDAAVSLVKAVIPALSDTQRLAAYADTFARLNASGLTGCCVMLGSASIVEACRQLEAADRLGCRLWIALHVSPDTSEEEVLELMALRPAQGRRWQAPMAKFFIDGVVESGTAWLYQPDTNGSGQEPFWPDPERYAALVTRFTRAGFSCVTHAIGDRAVGAALDAYAAAGPPQSGMHRVEHAETLTDHDLARLAAAGVGVCMQPLHLSYNQPDRSDPWSRALGDERCDRGFRTGDLVRSGAVVALGSDWPVARYDPRLGMAWARLRRAPGGSSDAPAYNAGQALSGTDTLAGYTTQPARLVGESQRLGRIAPGYLADLTGLSDDPVTIDPDASLALRVVCTISDGSVVYEP